jgi:hypothetical protein
MAPELCIYVDVENVRQGAAKLLGKPVTPFVVDPLALRRELARLAAAVPGRRRREWSAATVVMFTGTPPTDDHPSWIWYQPLRYLWAVVDGVEVRDHPVVVEKDGHTGTPHWKQDAVDVLLAVTAVRDAMEAKYRSIIIVSGDSDLAPAVQACAEKLGLLNVLTAAVQGSWKKGTRRPDIRLGAAVAKKLDMRVRLGEIAIHYAELFSIEDKEGNTQARKFVEYLADSEDPLTARRALTRAYLDAFWWWGSYERFDLCRSLIKGWDSYLNKMHADERPGHRRLLEALEAFDFAYPAGPDEDKQNAAETRWEAVGNAAQDLWRLLELDGELDEPADRHVAALVEIYLAESHRFRAGENHGASAAEHYGRAAELLTANKERWNLAWVQCDWAALSYERGDMAHALELCQAAEELARNLGTEQGEYLDYELLAKLSAIAAMSYLSDAGGVGGRPGGGLGPRGRRAPACVRLPGPSRSPPGRVHAGVLRRHPGQGAAPDRGGRPRWREFGLRVVLDGWRGLWPEEPVQPGDIKELAAEDGPADRRALLLGPPPPTNKQLRGERKAQYTERVAPLIDLLDEDGALETLAARGHPAAGQ